MAPQNNCSVMVLILFSANHYARIVYIVAHLPLFRFKSWNNGMRCMSFSILIVIKAWVFIYIAVVLSNRWRIKLVLIVLASLLFLINCYIIYSFSCSLAMELGSVFVCVKCLMRVSILSQADYITETVGLWHGRNNPNCDSDRGINRLWWAKINSG